jgi:hypothetical protein
MGPALVTPEDLDLADIHDLHAQHAATRPALARRRTANMNVAIALKPKPQ